ncbi:HU family DNA-binding protein, partial [Nostocoides sp.]|uniref:HU family DNA-binding protein n=1 Tax=Nostocoides sp. TaxID=1917966 RepID=UPI003BAF86CD
MNKADLVAAIESKLGSRKAATEAVETILEAIVTEVAKGGKVALTGFGTFEKAARAARTGRNPRTGETVKIRKTSVPRFTASSKFKGYVATPKSMPKGAPLARANSAAAAAVAAPARKTAAKTAGKAAAPAKA